MALIRARKGAWSWVADTFLFAGCLLILSVLSGYVFGALRMFGPSLADRTSPHTLASLMLLAFVAFGRRAEYGEFNILLSIGMGGRIARMATPVALAVPFLLAAAGIGLVNTGSMTIQYAGAIIASVASMLTFALVVALARQIEQQEREIRDLSLRDGLTELYNRRGFYILAEQALHHAQRSGAPFSVLFIDLDNLKSINDSLGHSIGSDFLSEVAALLRKTFSNVGILGRIGGDEFVVAGESREADILAAAHRLQDAADQLNAEPGRVYPLSFSIGHVTSTAAATQSLDDLLSAADKAMYQVKLRKKQQTRA